MRTELIAANWKMNLRRDTAVDLARAVRHAAEGGAKKREVLLAPPAPYLGPVREALVGSAILLAGQDVSAHEDGAFTGELSAEMLLDEGCRFSIIGHSERREHGGESDELIGRKVRRAFDVGLGAILCVGEKEDERLRGHERKVVERQLRAALENVQKEEADRLLTVAYEPVWAIGTGRTATPKDAAVMHRFIRDWVGGRFGAATAEAIRILYGGSVKPSNAADLLQSPEIDGALVGGASLKADSFSAILSA
ncbi:MAG: triose-phosphate isomerase [Candidatus Eisenbacteria bacterium]|nr:triose-phosphate isomerase [Candidatus Eisenbacteria bacterium]